MKLAFDTETRGLEWWNPDQRAFLASWADARSEYVADLTTSEGVERFHNAMRAADVVVAHNLPFDSHQTRETTGLDISEKELHDTDIQSRLVHPTGQDKARASHKLKDLAEIYLRADAKEAENAIKEMGKSIGYTRTIKKPNAYYDIWRAYPETMEEYARLDARYTYDLDELQRAEIQRDPRTSKVYALERDVQPILIRAEQRGVALDQEKVAVHRKRFGAERDELQSYLEMELGDDALEGAGSKDALAEALLKIGVPLTKKTKDGHLQTNKYVLEEHAEAFPQIRALMEWRTLERFLGTYLDPMVDREFIHTSFSQCEAWTGRMSSRRPNMQNIPVRAGSEVREVLVPRDGYCFLVSDYDSIEVRLLAWYLGDPGFRQLIDDGHDPHAWMAANIHGGEMEEYVKGAPKEDLRSAAKNTLFAITYGAGGPRVAAMNGISTDDARKLIAKIKRALPRYSNLNKRIRSKVEERGYVNTLWGRMNPVGKDKAYVGLNALIQGSAADVMKQGLVNVDRQISHLGATPLLVVHDEIVTECPIEHAEEALLIQNQAMAEAYDLSPSLTVSGTICYNSYAEGK